MELCRDLGAQRVEELAPAIAHIVDLWVNGQAQSQESGAHDTGTPQTARQHAATRLPMQGVAV